MHIFSHAQKVYRRCKDQTRKEKDMQDREGEGSPRYRSSSPLDDRGALSNRLGSDKIIKQTGIPFQKGLQEDPYPPEDEATKLRAIFWAREHGSNSAPKKFKVDKKF